MGKRGVNPTPDHKPGNEDIANCVRYLREEHRCAARVTCDLKHTPTGYVLVISAWAYEYRNGVLHANRETATYSLFGMQPLTQVLWRQLFRLCVKVDREGLFVLDGGGALLGL